MVDRDIVIGGILLATALGAITILVIHSRWTIHWIARKRVRSLREIMKQRNGEND